MAVIHRTTLLSMWLGPRFDAQYHSEGMRGREEGGGRLRLRNRMGG